jgi:hypothetical protein
MGVDALDYSFYEQICDLQGQAITSRSEILAHGVRLRIQMMRLDF